MRDSRTPRGILPGVADSKPHDLRRMAAEEAHLVEVRVFGGNDETAGGGVSPNGFVVRRFQPGASNVRGAGVFAFEETRQVER